MTTIKYATALVLLYFYVTYVFYLVSGRCVYVSTFNHCAEYIFQWCCCHLQNESSDEQPLSLKIKGINAALKEADKKKKTPHKRTNKKTPLCFLYRGIPSPHLHTLVHKYQNNNMTLNTDKRILQNKSLFRWVFSILSSIPLTEIQTRACRQPHERAFHLQSRGGTTPLPERSRWVTAVARPCLLPRTARRLA